MDDEVGLERLLEAVLESLPVVYIDDLPVHIEANKCYVFVNSLRPTPLPPIERKSE